MGEKEITYKCEECGREFTTKRGYDSHYNQMHKYSTSPNKGRPRKRPASKKRNRLRAQWRKASKRYYNNHKLEVLERARIKIP